MIKLSAPIALFILTTFLAPSTAVANCANWVQDATRAELRELFAPPRNGIIADCIRNGADPNMRFDAYDGAPAIFIAIFSKRGGWAVKELLDVNVNLDYIPENGWTVAHYAATYLNNTSTLSRILSQTDYLEVRTPRNGLTPLLAAARQGSDSRAVRQLLLDGSNINAIDNEGNTALHLAMRNRHPNVHVQETVSQYGDEVYRESRRQFSSIFIRDLAKNGADPDQLNANGETPLVYGLLGNAGPIAIEQIVLAGADVSIPAPDGRLPWEIAKLGIQYHSVFWDLVSDSSDVATCDHWNTRQFSGYVTEEILIDCIAEGHSVNTTVHNTGENLLHQISQNWPRYTRSYAQQEISSNAMLEVILESGGSIDAVDGFGRTALHLAAAASNEIWVSTLLKAGANPNISSYSGTTPIDAARFAGNDELALLLEEHHR